MTVWYAHGSLLQTFCIVVFKQGPSLSLSLPRSLSLSLSIAVYDTMYLQSFLINKRHVYIVHPPPLNITTPSQKMTRG